MHGSNVLEGHQDVPVELHVGNVLDRAVRGQDSLLVLATEERQLDLLALVLVRVVLHGPASLARTGRVTDGSAAEAGRSLHG